MDEVTVKVSGDLAEGGITTRHLARAVQYVETIVKTLNGDAAPPSILNIELGSVAITVAAQERAAGTLHDGLKALNAGKRPQWDQAVTDAIKDLAALSTAEGVTGTSLTVSDTTTQLDAQLIHTLEAALENTPQCVSYGTVTGRLYSYTSKKDYRARLEDQDGYSVKVQIRDEHLAQLVRQHLDQQVTITGRVTRDPYATVAYRVISVDIDSICETPARPILSGKELADVVRKAQKISRRLIPEDVDPVEIVQELRYG